MSGEKDFLSRWSARKSETRQAEEPAAHSAVERPEPTPEISPEELETLSDAELCEKLGLPDPATLNEGDDFRVFLENRVPERLRRVALRRLWRSNPIFSRLDGLDDYDEDFRAAGAATETIKTLYRVGEGFAKQLPEEAPEAVTNAAPSDDADLAIQKNAPMQDICGPERDSDESEESSTECDKAAPPPDSEAKAEESKCGRRSQITSRRTSFRFVEKPNNRA
jgi:hypothetical protein